MEKMLDFFGGMMVGFGVGFIVGIIIIVCGAFMIEYGYINTISVITIIAIVGGISASAIIQWNASMTNSAIVGAIALTYNIGLDVVASRCIIAGFIIGGCIGIWWGLKKKGG